MNTTNPVLIIQTYLKPTISIEIMMKLMEETINTNVHLPKDQMIKPMIQQKVINLKAKHHEDLHSSIHPADHMVNLRIEMKKSKTQKPQQQKSKLMMQQIHLLVLSMTKKMMKINLAMILQDHHQADERMEVLSTLTVPHMKKLHLT
jgi:hypothetical protein